MKTKSFKILIIALMIITSSLFLGYVIKRYQYNSTLLQEKKLKDALFQHTKEQANLENELRNIDSLIVEEDQNILDIEAKILLRTQNINRLEEQITIYEKLKKYDVTVFITPNNETVKSCANKINTNDPLVIYRFVKDEIKYLEDYVTHDFRFEYWQFPEETLKLKTGDCEDQAILLCTLLRANGYSPEDVKVVFGLTSSNAGHAWVELFYQDDWIVFDPTSDTNTYIEKTKYYSLINVKYKGSFNDIYSELIE